MRAQSIRWGKPVVNALSAVVLLLILFCAQAHAIEIPDYDTSVQVTLRDRTGVFLNGGRNFLGQNSVIDRFEQFLLIDGKTQFNKDLSMTIKLRGFVDNVFDVQRGNHWSGNSLATHELSNSFDLAYDDVLREAYFDYNLGQLPEEDGKLFARIGKQQVVWGKADGFRLLDLINPFDYREPFYPNFEDVRIPMWMINLNYTLPRQVLQNASLQLIGNPFYQQDTFPPPWFHHGRSQHLTLSRRRQIRWVFACYLTCMTEASSRRLPGRTGNPAFDGPIRSRTSHTQLTTTTAGRVCRTRSPNSSRNPRSIL